MKLPKKTVPQHVHAAGVIVRDGKVLLARRPSEGLLGGMWEFPNGRVTGDPFEGLAQALKTGYNLRLRTRRSSVQDPEPLAVVHHGYTHFKVTVHAYRCELAGEPDGENLKWIRMEDMAEYPMGRIDRQIAEQLLTMRNT